MRGSPVLWVSIQPLILGSLRGYGLVENWGGLHYSPFILLANKVLFAQIDKISDGFGSEKLETVDNINLMECISQSPHMCTTQRRRVRMFLFSWVFVGRYSLLDELGFEHTLFFIVVDGGVGIYAMCSYLWKRNC